jgi:hypothetical protein
MAVHDHVAAVGYVTVARCNIISTQQLFTLGQFGDEVRSTSFSACTRACATQSACNKRGARVSQHYVKHTPQHCNMCSPTLAS